MKKLITLALAAVFMLGVSATIHADQTPTAAVASADAVTGTSMAGVEAPKWFNGNWLVVPNYGRPNTDGGTAFDEVKVQAKAYKTAREAGDLKGLDDKVKNAFWTSVQAWAYNNAGLAKIHEADAAGGPKAGEKALAIYSEAETFLNKGLGVIHAAAKLEGGENDAQTAAFKGEVKARHDSRKMLAHNLLYAERCLGKKPWPKEQK